MKSIEFPPTQIDRIRRLTHELENTQETFFDLAPDLCCVADRLGYFKKVNRSWERILGWSEDELLSEPFINLVHPDDVDKTMDILEYMSENDVTRFHNRYRRKPGSVNDLELVVVAGDDDYTVLEWNATAWNDGLTYAVARQVPLSCLKCKDTESRFNLIHRSGHRHDPKRRQR